MYLLQMNEVSVSSIVKQMQAELLYFLLYTINVVIIQF